MVELETDRLRFRKWHPDDYEPVRTFYQLEENAQFVGGIKNAEASWRLIASYLGHFELLGYSYLAVEEKKSSQLIGTVGLWNSEPWPEPELGYWLLPAAQGKGFALEAGEVVRNFGIKTLNLPSLVSYIDPANKRSKKLAQKLGAQYDKTINLLDFGPHEIYRYK